MRFFEIGMVGFTILAWVALRLERWPGLRWAALLGLALMALAHWRIEGARWQMVPAYAAAAVTAVLLVASLIGAATPELPSFVSIALPAVLLIVSVGLPVVFPVPRLPAPSGVFQVGTTVRALRDEKRAEVWSGDPNAKREVVVQVWYPATPKSFAPNAPWMDRIDVVGPAIANWLHFPSFILNHAALLRTHSYADAALSIAQARYPVILYSHGWGGFRAINSTQSEDLASRGYIVVAIDHPYGALVASFPDGRVIMNKPDLLPPHTAPNYDSATRLLEKVFADDIAFVTDQLQAWNQSDAFFKDHLDMDHLGVFGHSTGGGAAVQFCARDARCKALVGQDAWIEPVPPDVIDAGLSTPSLFIRSEEWIGHKNDELLFKMLGNGSGAWWAEGVAGAAHYDFVMIAQFSPLASALRLKGPINGDQMHRILTQSMAAFFDTHLKGAPDNLPQTAGTFPEVTFQSHP